LTGGGFLMMINMEKLILMDYLSLWLVDVGSQIGLPLPVAI
jgi:hypothetical protein